jgi:hypothetical protein
MKYIFKSFETIGKTMNYDLTTKILLYSKYSNSSKQLLDLLTSKNLIELLNITLLCIDNEIYRKRILLSPLEISNVPCLLLIHNGVKVDKYESFELIDWINYQISLIQKNDDNIQNEQLLQQQQQQQMLLQQQQQQQMLLQQQQQQQMLLQQQQQQQILLKQQQQMLKQQEVTEESESFETTDEIVSNDPVTTNEFQAKQEMQYNQIKNKPKDQIISGGTSIDDIISDEEEKYENNVDEETSLNPLTEQEVAEIIPKPKNKKKKENISTSHNYNEYETKNKKREQKKLDLLNAATMMMKSREVEDKHINKNFQSM